MEHKVLAVYLDELARELRVRGVFDLRIIEEIQGHLLDAVEHGQERGLSLDEAQREAVGRFGNASIVAMQFALDRRRRMYKLLLGVALGVGVLIGYVDSRPAWDDAGVTAFAIVISCGIFGMIGPKRPWLWAVGIGM